MLKNPTQETILESEVIPKSNMLIGTDVLYNKERKSSTFELKVRKENIIE